jgi:phosphoglycerate dehydrogenase-like enzyme
MRIVIAIHDLPMWSIPDSEVDRITRALPEDDVVNARELDARRQVYPDAEVLFATKLRAEEFALARRLRWIHSSAVGVGTLLSPALVQSDVIISNSRGVHSEAIAEHAIALALGVRRQLHVAVARQGRRQWAQEEMYERRVPTLGESRLLVIGLGTIGARVAAYGAGLGMRVTAIRRRMDEPLPRGVSEVLAPDKLKQALGSADVVVLALPRTEETRALIGREEFDAMKPSAVLVNVARGRLVDDDALVDALKSGRIAGAGLDAFHAEPLPADHPLWELPNVLITPHTASFSGDYWPPVVDLFLKNLQRFRRGETLINVVDKQRGY